jgi:hypothetical protein
MRSLIRGIQAASGNSGARRTSKKTVAMRVFLVALLAVIATAAVTHAGTGKPKRFHFLAHVNPGGGYSADVVGERHYAYLSSRADGNGKCPGQGVRVYDLAHLRRPRHIATFADGRSNPELANSWRRSSGA